MQSNDAATYAKVNKTLKHRCPRCNQDRPAVLEPVKPDGPDQIEDVVIRCPECGETRIHNRMGPKWLVSTIAGTDEPYEMDRNLWEARQKLEKLRHDGRQASAEKALELADALEMVAACFDSKDRTEECFEAGQEVLDELRPYLGSSTEAMDRYLGQLMTQSTVAQDLGDFDNVIGFVGQAFETGRGQTTVRYAGIVSHYALMYGAMHQDDMATAIKYGKQAVALAEKLDKRALADEEVYTLAIAYETLARLLNKRGNGKSAQNYAIKALNEREDNLKMAEVTEERLMALEDLYRLINDLTEDDSEAYRLISKVTETLKPYADVSPLVYGSFLFNTVCSSPGPAAEKAAQLDELIALLKNCEEPEERELLAETYCNRAMAAKDLSDPQESRLCLDLAYETMLHSVLDGNTKGLQLLLTLAADHYTELSRTDPAAVKQMLSDLKPLKITKTELIKAARALEECGGILQCIN